MPLPQLDVPSSVCHVNVWINLEYKSSTAGCTQGREGNGRSPTHYGSRRVQEAPLHSRWPSPMKYFPSIICQEPVVRCWRGCASRIGHFRNRSSSAWTASSRVVCGGPGIDFERQKRPHDSIQKRYHIIIWNIQPNRSYIMSLREFLIHSVCFIRDTL